MAIKFQVFSVAASFSLRLQSRAKTYILLAIQNAGFDTNRPEHFENAARRQGASARSVYKHT